MGRPVSVSVGWALWGKHPGAVREYSVIASSGEPLSEAEFTSVLTHFMPGTPSAEPDAPRVQPAEPDPPGSLPWVTISRVGVAERVYLGVSIQDSTGTLDGLGRPITGASYFCIAFDQLRDALFSYVDLYRQLAEVRLPYDGGGPIQLDVATLDPGEVAQAVDGFGEATVEAAAAMLLSGPVSVVGSEGTALYGRLRFLDAVAALLPYGYRTAYTAATWSDSGKHPIRLAFAARPRQDAGIIRWRSGPMAAPGGAGEDYLRLLQQIRARLPEHDHLVGLIKFMEKDKVTCGFDQPQRAIAAVRDFGLPYIMLNAVREGTAEAGDLQAVFARGRAEDLTADERRELLAGLIATAHRDRTNWQVIDDWWDRIVGGEPRVMLPALERAGRRLLWTAAPDRLACQDLLGCAARHGMLDDLLAQLIAARGTEPPPAGSLQTAAQLTADAIGRPGIAHLRLTGQALVRDPLVVCELITHLAGARQGLEPVLTWLRPALGGVLAPFAALAGRAPGEINQHDIGQLADRDPQYVSALLNSAHDLDRLVLVLPGFTSWLGNGALGRGGPGPGQSQYWRVRLDALNPRDPAACAWLDLALLISGNKPRWLLELRTQGSLRLYNETVVRGWETLQRRLGSAADERLTNGLADYLGQANWPAASATAVIVTSLVRQLTIGGQRRRLNDTVADRLRHTPEAARWSFAAEWLPQGKEKRRGAPRDERQDGARDEPQAGPGDQRRNGPAERRAETREYPLPADLSELPAGGNAILTALAGLRGDAAADQVGGLLADACRNSVNIDEAGRALRDSSAINSGPQAMAVLDAFRHALRSQPVKRAEVQFWLRQFTVWFANGVYGVLVAERFRSLAIQSSVEHIDHYIGMLYSAMSADRLEQASLDRPDAELLAEARKNLDEILRGPRKSGGLIPNLLRGRQG